MHRHSAPESIAIAATEEMQDLGRTIAALLAPVDQRFSYLSLGCTMFANGELKVKIPESIRYKDVYLLHSLHYPDPNTSLVKLLLAIDALARASAKSITLVLPYIPYLRQDRKDESRVPISACVVADMLQSNPKVERILTLDTHSDQVQGFFRIPVDNLYGASIHRDHFRALYAGKYDDLIVVSPDHGGSVRARRFAKALEEHLPVYIVDKRRVGPNKVQTLHFVGGDITGKDIILYDDMIDTGGSIMAAAALARERGARNVSIVATHGIFSSHGGVSAEKRFAEAGMNVFVTTSIPRSAEYYRNNAVWLTALPIDELLTRAIYESSIPGGSVSSLF